MFDSPTGAVAVALLLGCAAGTLAAVVGIFVQIMQVRARAKVSPDFGERPVRHRARA